MYNNNYEHLTHIMLEDLGFTRVNRGDEIWSRVELDAIGYRITAVDLGWAFEPRRGGPHGAFMQTVVIINQNPVTLHRFEK